MDTAVVIGLALGKWASLTVALWLGYAVAIGALRRQPVDGRKSLGAAAAAALFLLLEGWI